MFLETYKNILWPDGKKTDDQIQNLRISEFQGKLNFNLVCHTKVRVLNDGPEILNT